MEPNNNPLTMPNAEAVNPTVVQPSAGANPTPAQAPTIAQPTTTINMPGPESVINDTLDPNPPVGTPILDSSQIIGEGSAAAIVFYRDKKKFKIIGLFLPFFITFLIVLTGGIFDYKNNKWQELDHNQKIKLASMVVIGNLLLVAIAFAGLILLVLA